MSPFETKFLDVRTVASHSDVLLDISVLEGMAAGLIILFQFVLSLYNL